MNMIIKLIIISNFETKITVKEIFLKRNRKKYGKRNNSTAASDIKCGHKGCINEIKQRRFLHI